MNELIRALLFLPEQASTAAPRIDQLHFFVVSVTMLMSAVVGLTAIYFFWRYRRRRENETTPYITPTAPVEVLFVTVPLVFFLLWFFIGFKDFIWLTTPPKNAMDVYVMGKQWMWKYSYADGPNSVSTLRVPAGRPVRLLITSRDVIHSYFVPAFRVKRDAVPGRYTELWFEATKPGRYPVFCTEYCGLSHSGMVGEVIVMPPAEFDSWMADTKVTLASRQDSPETAAERPSAQSNLVEQGKQEYIHHGCGMCHTVDGAPHLGPTWKGAYGSMRTLQDGTQVVVDEAYLTESMMDPGAKMAQGFANIMPSFRGQLSPGETAALLEYIKSLRSPAIEREN